MQCWVPLAFVAKDICTTTKGVYVSRLCKLRSGTDKWFPNSNQTHYPTQVVSSGTVGPVVDALAHASSSSSAQSAGFSAAAAEEILRQYNSVSSGEMRNLSTALQELLVRYKLRLSLILSFTSWFAKLCAGMSKITS